MSSSTYIDCPACSRPVDRSLWVCPLCGADITWLQEERRLAKQHLRYLAVAVVGGVLVSVAVLIPMGFLQRFTGLLVPLWVALIASGAVLWLAAGSFGASPRARSKRPD